MALRNVVVEGDPILRKHCRNVENVDDRTRMILDDMLETMRAQNGVGIAAPQVGIMRRMFVVEAEPDQVYYMINPEIVEAHGTQIGEEGCLSVPGYVGTVERPEFIRIQYTDRDGKQQSMTAKDFLAVVINHEYDHLDGILYIDKAKNIHDVDDALTEESK